MKQEDTKARKSALKNSNEKKDKEVKKDHLKGSSKLRKAGSMKVYDRKQRLL